MKCIYCYKEFNTEEFTAEHIIPKAIGGNIEPINPFIINSVCKRCNNLAGLYIDAPFTKNWLIDNSRVTNAKKFVNLSKKPILPLRYFGQIDNIKFEDKICEFWIGPTGDSIYHFHIPYPHENSDLWYLRKSLNKKIIIDPGFVFLFITANNPAWHPSIIYSVIEEFKGSIIYLGNGNSPNINPFKVIPQHLLNLQKELLDLEGKEHNCSISLPFASEERFLAKIALGLGCLFLDSGYIDSEDAQKLRSYMWEKDYLKRQQMGIRLTKLIKEESNDSKFMRELFNWKGGHVITLFSIGSHLSLIANFYEDHNLGILISQNSCHWKDKLIDERGMCFIIIPGLKKIVGPLSIGTLIAYKSGHVSDPAIKELEELMASYESIPPYNI